MSAHIPVECPECGHALTVIVDVDTAIAEPEPLPRQACSATCGCSARHECKGDLMHGGSHFYDQACPESWTPWDAHGR